MVRLALWLYVIGICNAALMYYSIPVLNWKGAVYIAATTPVYPFCYVVGCDPMPPQWLARHFFTYEATP